CLHEVKLIVDLMYEEGITGMRYSISDTAEYGDVTRGPRVITPATKKAMQKILKEIQSGKFAREWIKESEEGRANFNALREAGAKLCVNPAEDGALEQLKALDGGVWGVVDLVGAENTASMAIACLRKGGRYVLVGLYGGELALSLVPLAQRAITLQGSYVGSLQELREVVALAQSGKLKPIPTRVCSMQEVSSILDQLKAGTVIGRVVAKAG
ncbi:MAG: hypothetical protein EBW54_05520, partial [Betaproteobacteria bacterium]|nr:hypothetical protein [Betaproteobacteria bacterium]